MGTPDFAVPALSALITPPPPPLQGGGVREGYEVVAVVTQPDRPSGRGKQLIPSPVKRLAQSAGLKVLQPETLKDEAAVAELAALEPDLMVVAAFGQILRQNVLTLPLYGCINIHASLLPRWRGAAPVAAAIRAGDAETGVTLMLMDTGLDTGPMLARRSVPITPQHTAGTLTAELAEVGAALLLETLPAWFAGEIEPQPQDNSQATLAPRLKKEQGVIHWTQSAVEIERQVRAFDPWPGTFTEGPRGPFKILVVEVAEMIGPSQAGPGTVFKYQGRVYVSTGQGVVRLVIVQPAGKKEMTAEAMLNGQPELLGARLREVEV
ncbi:MAG: methionyl-tRNA formyltransferase [Chloroflexota bacterium]|nr:MAG: methionyl-tRNA formyltransferase [Chloroflexota bacterium]